MKSLKSIRPRFNTEAGFTLIEVLISMFVLTIGMLSLLGVFGLSMSGTMTAQEDRIAKQLAQDAYESIYTARDTANVPWANIENIAGGGTGIFVSGFQPIYQSGADAIIGTADDASILIALLSDAQWWVRYRAAQALARLPSVDVPKLESIQAAQSDRFARDMLSQVIAEVHLR